MKGLHIIGIVILTAACTVSAEPDATALLKSAQREIEQGHYTDALNHLAQITIFHSRDPNIAPAAVFYEALVYKQTGHPEAARQTAEELVLGWPGSDWSRRADELK